MKVLGIGMLSAQGSGIEAFERSLINGWQPPTAVASLRETAGKRFAYQVNFDAAVDKALLKKIRRADKVSKMAVLAASDALTSSGIPDIVDRKPGIILATAFGAHVTTFEFLDDVLEYGDAAVSPTKFSNSVHNAATSYISTSLDIKAPTMTVTQFRFSFPAALQLAQAWLDQGRCDYVLVGAVDQYGDVLGYVSEEKLAKAPDGKIKPFSFKPTYHVAGEGAAFFLLSREKTGNAFCSIDSVRIDDDRCPAGDASLNIIAADGMLADESCYAAWLSSAIPTAAYSPLYGSMMTGGAFSIAAGALMLKKQMLYASPVLDNPRGVRLLAETGTASIDAVCCIDANCYGEKASVYLGKA
jgi:3-oxoacyl-[acyl-carrier-protein] synthase II